MTWGSNATFDPVPCPYCGQLMVDDTEQWPTSHMRICERRSWWRKALAWLRARRAAAREEQQ